MITLGGSSGSPTITGSGSGGLPERSIGLPGAPARAIEPKVNSSSTHNAAGSLVLV
jgi:hypothetical protein